MKKCILFIIVLLTNLFAQRMGKPMGEYAGILTNQLKIGNVFIYRDYYWRPEARFAIIDTIRINNTLYYAWEWRSSNGVNYPQIGDYITLRKDGYYVAYSPNTPYYTGNYLIFYKKNPQVGDFWVQTRFNCDTCKIYYKIKREIYYWILFLGRSIPVKELEITDSVLTHNWEYWSDDFGLVNVMVSDDFSSPYILWSCVINDSVYGDTTFVSVKDDIGELIKDYELYQNFPNPFNGVTTIRYKLSKSGFVRLRIYDILGNEITTLVNEEKLPGDYYVDFDSEKVSEKINLPSGIYLYELSVNNFKKTKKMLLIK